MACILEEKISFAMDMVEKVRVAMEMEKARVAMEFHKVRWRRQWRR